MGAAPIDKGLHVSKGDRLIATNKKAYHDYFVEETFETGIELTGTEVKSLRENRASLRESFATITQRRGVAARRPHRALQPRQPRNVEPDRKRKLLLHKKEIRYLIGKTKERGYTLVPLSIYFSPTNMVKVELGLARGKKLYDKRDAIAERDQKRDVERALRERQKGE